MSQPPAPKPPRQSSTNVPPQTVPVQPVANSHQRGQGKKSYTLLFILLGAAALVHDHMCRWSGRFYLVLLE